MTSEKDSAIIRNSNHKPQAVPGNETEVQRREKYIQTTFRENIRLITMFLRSDITRFPLDVPIIKELEWNFHTTYNATHLYKIRFFLTSLEFEEKVEENKPGLTVFRYHLPINKCSIHVKITESIKRIIIHIHMDKQVHIDQEFNKFTSFLLEELRKYLRIIYKPFIFSQQMNIEPKKLKRLKETKELISRHAQNKKLLNIEEFKTQFLFLIPEIMKKSVDESSKTNHLISAKRMGEISYQTIIYSCGLSIIRALEHSGFNIRNFLEEQSNKLHSGVKNHYLKNKKKKAQRLQKQLVSKDHIEKSKVHNNIVPKSVKNPQIPPDIVFRITPEEQSDLEEWGYYDEEEEFINFIDSEVSENIMIEGKTSHIIINHPKEIKRKLSEEELLIFDEFIQSELDRIYHRVKQSRQYTFNKFVIMSEISANFNNKIIQYDTPTFMGYMNEFNLYYNERWDADYGKLQKKILKLKQTHTPKRNGLEGRQKKRIKIHYRQITFSPTLKRNISVISLWILCSAIPLFSFYFILTTHYLSLEELFSYFPLENLSLIFSAFVYGLDLEGLFFFIYRKLKGYAVIQSDITEELIPVVVLFNFLAFFSNWWFLSMLF